MDGSLQTTTMETFGMDTAKVCSYYFTPWENTFFHLVSKLLFSEASTSLIVFVFQYPFVFVFYFVFVFVFSSAVSNHRPGVASISKIAPSGDQTAFSWIVTGDI